MGKGKIASAVAGIWGRDEGTSWAAKSTGKDQTVAPDGPDVEETLDVPERAEDRKTALRMHRARFREQIIGWGFKMAMAGAAYPFFRIEIDLLSPWSRATTAPIVFYSALAIFVAVCYGLPLCFAWLVGSNFYHHHEIKSDWKTAKARAKQFADPEEVARGWTEVFSIYVRTKRTSYHLLSWAIVAFLYAFVGSLALLFSP
ncbi:MAG TPA: hypothetical protein VMU01_12575, partial [Rhizomicrobium sp.]|nr:hypothetical protein [Rhizomicrobium sp.]